MNEKCYSADGEQFSLDMQSATYESSVGDTIYVGEASQPCASRYVPDADWVIEYMGEQADDDIGEAAEDWPDVSKEAKQELEAFLKDWAVRNCQVNFYRVKNVQEYVLTEGDF